MIQVYCAGAYNSDNVIGVLRNMRSGIEYSLDLMTRGFSVVCPWLDFQYGLHKEIPIDTYRANSMEQLRRSDCLFLVPGWEDSIGTQAEIAEAERLGIPVFETTIALTTWSISKTENHKVCEMCRNVKNNVYRDLP